ncbi:MAG: hypothetical protein R3B09_14720 [Nannocystaceae bacterium]
MSPRLCIVAFALGLFAGCFRQAPLPPDFRYECVSDDECVSYLGDDGEPLLNADGDPYKERCINGLCQYPCGGSLLDILSQQADNGCPPNESYVCFNGLCANLCDGSKDPTTCSSPQKCVELATLDVIADNDAAQTYIEKSFTIERPGVCGLTCDNPEFGECPDGQICTGGMCLDLSDFGTTGTTGGTTTDGGTTDTDATSGGTGP